MTENIVWEPYSKGIKQSSPWLVGDIVCFSPTEKYDESLAEWPKRARLICAAPRLLAACERVLEWENALSNRTCPIPWDTGVLPLMRDAVAEATGANIPAEPEPLCGVGCPICEDEGHTPDEPAPALKTWWIRTHEGPLSMTAERAEEYDGGLAFYVGTNIVGRVAAGRWIAYWEDAND